MKGYAKETGLFHEVDSGRYQPVVDNLDSLLSSQEPENLLLAAEVLAYLDRVQEAEQVLERVSPPAPRVLERRLMLVKAECAIASDRLEEALEAAGELVRVSEALGDGAHLLRALIIEVRVHVRRGEYETAVAACERPRAIALERENDFAFGVVAYLCGYALTKLSRYPRASEKLVAAVGALGRAERFRWYGWARNFYGVYLTDIGQYQAALVEFVEAERIARDVGSWHDELWARNNAARVQLIRGEVADAVARLEELVEWTRFDGASRVEQCALHMLGFGYGLGRRWSDVERIGEELASLAEITRHREGWAAGTLLGLWARAAREDRAAEVELARWITCLDAGTLDVPWGGETYRSEQSEVEARLFLADAIVGRRVLEAIELVEQAVRRETVVQGSPLRELVDRVRLVTTGGPLKIHGERLVIDLGYGYPTLDEATRAVEWFLLSHAYEQEGRNGEAAGRRLGISRSRFHDRWKAVHGEPVRPKRAPAPRDESREQ
jgi:tetratricopeptide (TPR) repeat protein